MTSAATPTAVESPDLGTDDDLCTCSSNVTPAIRPLSGPTRRPLAPTCFELPSELCNDVEATGNRRLHQADGQGTLDDVTWRRSQTGGAQSQNLGWLGVALRRHFRRDFATIHDAWRGRRRSVRSPVAPLGFAGKTCPF